jgi:hypothetical protein
MSAIGFKGTLAFMDCRRAAHAWRVGLMDWIARAQFPGARGLGGRAGFRPLSPAAIFFAEAMK